MANGALFRKTWRCALSLLQLLELFAWLKANGLARGDGDFGAGARIATDAGFAGPDVKDTKSS
jgi:hypothetical protein